MPVPVSQGHTRTYHLATDLALLWLQSDTVQAWFQVARNASITEAYSHASCFLFSFPRTRMRCQVTKPAETPIASRNWNPWVRFAVGKDALSGVPLASPKDRSGPIGRLGEIAAPSLQLPLNWDLCSDTQ